MHLLWENSPRVSFGKRRLLSQTPLSDQTGQADGLTLSTTHLPSTARPEPPVSDLHWNNPDEHVGWRGESVSIRQSQAPSAISITTVFPQSWRRARAAAWYLLSVPNGRGPFRPSCGTNPSGDGKRCPKGISLLHSEA